MQGIYLSEKAVLPLASSRTSSNGPDVTDVGVMMAAIGELHAVAVKMEVLPGGGRELGYVILIALAVGQVNGIAALPRSVSVKCVWPNRESKTFEGAMYKLCHELDAACSKEFWVQLGV